MFGVGSIVRFRGVRVVWGFEGYFMGKRIYRRVWKKIGFLGNG